MRVAADMPPHRLKPSDGLTSLRLTPVNHIRGSLRGSQSRAGTAHSGHRRPARNLQPHRRPPAERRHRRRRLCQGRLCRRRGARSRANLGAAGNKAIAASLESQAIRPRLPAAWRISPACHISRSTATKPSSPRICKSSRPTSPGRRSRFPITAPRAAITSTAWGRTAGTRSHPHRLEDQAPHAAPCRRLGAFARNSARALRV